jgi:hypothetical protein
LGSDGLSNEKERRQLLERLDLLTQKLPASTMVPGHGVNHFFYFLYFDALTVGFADIGRKCLSHG